MIATLICLAGLQFQVVTTEPAPGVYVTQRKPVMVLAGGAVVQQRCSEPAPDAGEVRRLVDGLIEASEARKAAARAGWPDDGGAMQ